MFGVLLESRATRQRRTGGAVLSAATHVAIVAAVAIFATRGPVHAAPPDKPVVVNLAPVGKPPETRSTAHTQSGPRGFNPPAPVVVRIEIPNVTPVGLPPIVPNAGPSLDSIIIGNSRGGTAKGIVGGLLDEPAGDGGREWRGSELMMRITQKSTLRYPEMLRQAGIDGRVLLRFVVDTTGGVDPASIVVVNSTHDLFTSSARTALLGFRFRPAEVDGHRVRALAEMPFEFTLK